MKIVFFGTSDFAARILQFLLETGVPIVAVVTRPDKPKGRSLQILPPPVKEKVLQLKPSLPIFQPVKASTSEFTETLKAFSPDLFIVASYGEIIKQMLLDLPRHGCINVHPSLLPKYRGATPMQRCLMQGDKESGVTIMKMVLEMDAGDILEMVRIPIPENMTLGELEAKLSELAGPLLVSVIERIVSGTISAAPQDHKAATFAPKISPEDEAIDWSHSSVKIHNQIRALSPSPCAYGWVQIGSEKKRIKIKRSEVITVSSEQAAQPGSPLAAGKNEWIVACGQGALKLLEVQLEGKKSMSAADFLRGIQCMPKFFANNFC